MANEKKQLYGIPYAGGSSSAFKELSTCLDNDIEMISIEYPGRGNRRKEPFAKDIDELTKDVKQQIIFSRDTRLPYALLGYS